ncbi:cytochrome C [Panacibacter ginsenosidivorans]|uniref:Cytochrome C n=1 Tax=Panacibacter ginsenosidivorans TaxID=1813871 RepID=A0A5B8VEH5_9BACT|nr:heme-binding domain-containing protein [Panacibacter ginsenosidivorans]QEC69722.1 cytochrome C [Panacibacter ginsenosidivorans]
MKRIKKISLVLLVLLIAIQFLHPARNESLQQLPTDIATNYKVPDSVFRILKTACYDCHSNNTRYPWYSNIQPMAWMMANHISNGKEELNFSEFGGYSIRRQTSKFKSIADQVKDDAMPLWSYELMHKDANLSDDEKKLIMNWAQILEDSLSANN